MPRGIYPRRPCMKTYGKTKGREEAILSLYIKSKNPNLHDHDPRNAGGVPEIAALLGLHPNSIYRVLRGS